jgi:excisionase family DNA binding protein
VADAPRYLTLKQVMAETQLSGATIRRAAKRGALKAAKVNGGRVWRFRRDWVDEWLASGLVAGHTSAEVPR